MRKLFVAFVTFVGGAYFLLEFWLPAQIGPIQNPLSPYQQLATDLVIILGTMAFLLGPFNLVRSGLANIVRRGKDWDQNAIFMVFMVLGIVCQSLYDWLADDPDASENWRAFAEAFYSVMFYGVVMGFGAASAALLALYLTSAAFRSFRFQNLDSGVMMIAAVIVLLGFAPLTDLLTGFLPDALKPNTWARWILDVPNTAVQRAVALGVCAGVYAVGVRHWLSIGTRAE